MKTLCFSLGLLLFVACCSDAMPASQLCNSTPKMCCLNFSTAKIPRHKMVGINRTSSCCPHKAFIVTTVGGKENCYKDDFEWAMKTFNNFHSGGSN